MLIFGDVLVAGLYPFFFASLRCWFFGSQSLIGHDRNSKFLFGFHQVKCRYSVEISEILYAYIGISKFYEMRCPILFCFHFVPKTCGFLSECSLTNGIQTSSIPQSCLQEVNPPLAFNPNEFITNMPPDSIPNHQVEAVTGRWESGPAL